MNTFKENLQAVPQADQTVLLRLYNPKDELVALMPNLPGKGGPLRVFRQIADQQGRIDFAAARNFLLRRFKIRLNCAPLLLLTWN